MQNDDMVGPDGRAGYEIPCPNGHVTKAYYTPKEWIDGLTAGTLRFSCGRCGDQHYLFSEDQRADILQRLRARGF